MEVFEKANLLTCSVDPPGCKDIDDWGSWDPITKVPRVGCLDTVSRADCEFFALKCFPDRGSLIADCIPIS